ESITLVRSLAPPVPIITLFFLAACSGPQSALDPAGPSALSVSRLWWSMFGFSALVVLAVTALWLYAMWRKPGDIAEAEARRLSNRWIIGGGLLLPVASIVALVSIGIPMGYRMLPLPLAEAPLR